MSRREKKRAAARRNAWAKVEALAAEAQEQRAAFLGEGFEPIAPKGALVRAKFTDPDGGVCANLPHQGAGDARMTRQSVLFTVPIRTQGTGNRRDHWGLRARRAANERGALALIASGLRSSGLVALPHPLVVTLVRIWSESDIPGKGQAALDEHDNLRQALKPIADEVTRALGFASDRDPDLAFTYGQERGEHPAVRVLIQGPCRARTLIYDVEPGSKPGDGSARVEWTEDPEAHAARQLRETRGVPGSNDDEIAAPMVAEELKRRAEVERDG
ncbi:MAG TPA: hypothetical protein VMY76_00760 [Gemmatimonadales bacterium]|nr:hypothetical protein [Gemmatimonadales bacterium]